MDEQGGRQQRREYLAYCWSVLPGQVGGRLTGDGDDGRLTAPTGGADGGNIWHIPTTGGQR